MNSGDPPTSQEFSAIPSATFTSVLVMLVLFCWGFLWYKGNKKQEKHTHKQKLGGGFKCFLFSSLPGETIQFGEHIFQMALVQPPTRKTWNISPGLGDHLVLTDTFLLFDVEIQNGPRWPYVTLHKWWVRQVQVGLAACCDGRCCWDISYGSHRMHVHIPTWKP